jgi:O-antigen ligase
MSFAAFKDRLNLREALCVLLILIAFGLSLFFNGYRDLIYAPAIILLLIAGCLSILPPVLNGRLNLPASLTAMLMFGLWVFITLSLSWSSVPYASLVTYLVFCCLPLAFLMPLTAEKWEPVLAVCKGLCGGAALLAGWAVVQFLFIPGDFAQRAQGPFSDPNALAALLSLALLPLLGLYFGVTGRDRGWIWPLAVLVIAGILATESRAALGCVAAAYILLSLWMKPKARSHARILIPALILFIACNLAGHMHFGKRLASLAAPAHDNNLLARLSLWKSTWQMIAEHPVFGSGFGTFYVYYPAHRIPGLDNSAGFWAHMDPLQFWSELGVAGPLLFYTLAVAILLRTIRALREEGISGRERGMIAGLGAGMAALFLQAHFSFPFYQMPILIALGSALALWHALTAAPVKTLELPGGQRAVIALVAVCISGFIALMAVSSALGTHYLVVSQKKIRNNDAQGFLDATEKAQSVAPVSFIEPQVQLAGMYIDMLNAPSPLFPMADRVNMYKQALLLLDNAQLFNPGWADIDYKRGLLFAAGGGREQPADTEKAKAEWEKALKKNPMHYKARERLIDYAMKRGDVGAASKLVQDALKYPHTPDVQKGFREMERQVGHFTAIKEGYESGRETRETKEAK